MNHYSVIKHTADDIEFTSREFISTKEKKHINGGLFFVGGSYLVTWTSYSDFGVAQTTYSDSVVAHSGSLFGVARTSYRKFVW